METLSPQQMPIDGSERYIRAVALRIEGNTSAHAFMILRHTMAAHSLVKMIGEEMDIYAALPLLAACLGHKTLTATEKYVRLTCSEYPDLLQQCLSLNNFIYGKEDGIE